MLLIILAVGTIVLFGRLAEREIEIGEQVGHCHDLLQRPQAFSSDRLLGQNRAFSVKLSQEVMTKRKAWKP